MVATDQRPVDRVARPDCEVPAGASLTLLCCAHSGGSASYFRGWPGLAPGLDVVPVQYPGREERIHDPLPRRLLDLADEVVRLASRTDGPIALFGHSMGAAVAFEAARALSAAGRPPAALIASGRTPPTYPIRSRIHLLPGDRMWHRLAELGGVHPEILAYADLRELLDPVVREDLRVSETYLYRGPLPALDCPVLAASGNDDPVAPPAAMRDWSELTAGRFLARSFDGDHFYLAASAEALLHWIRAEVAVPAAAS